MPNQLKDKLLIVDDDKNIVKLLTVLFSKTYDLKTAQSGEEAIGIVKGGFTPGVIISDQLMPGMNGVELLLVMKKISPRSVTIILTGITSPKEIIKIVNDCHAYMFMKKPFNNLELLQSIKIAFNQFNNLEKKKELSIISEKYKRQFEAINEKLNSIKANSGSGVSQTIKMLSNLSKINEYFYFKDHINDVSQIAQHLAMRCELDEKKIKNVVYGSLLHMCWMIGLPDKYKLINLHEITDKSLRNEIIDHFKRYIYAMKQNDEISEYVNVAIKIFEHVDGSGLPIGSAGINFPEEAQIISLANMYHDFVYKLPLDRVHELKQNGTIIQNKEETYSRHQSCVSFMYKNLKWYDHDIFRIFQEMLKKRDILALAFVARDLKLTINPNAHAVITEEDDRIVKKYEDLLTKEKKHIVIVDSNGNEIENFVQVKIKSVDLEKGMKLTQDIFMNDKTLLVKKFSVLNAKTLFKIEELVEAGAIGEYIYIVDPEELV